MGMDDNLVRFPIIFVFFESSHHACDVRAIRAQGFKRGVTPEHAMPLETVTVRVNFAWHIASGVDRLSVHIDHNYIGLRHILDKTAAP